MKKIRSVDVGSMALYGAVLFAFVSVACQGASSPLVAPTAAPSESSSSSTAAISSLFGGTWRLVGINGQKALASVAVTAVFGSENSLSGSGGCNRYSGTATANDGKLTVSPLAATRMYCAESGVGDQEQAYFSALAKATGYAVLGTELRLSPEKGDATLVFVRE
jgi:heat shock protein HslJ